METSINQSASLDTHMNADANQNNSQSTIDERVMDMSKNTEEYERGTIDGTPFYWQKNKDGQHRIGIGNHGVADWMTQQEFTEIMLKLAEGEIPSWQFLTNCIAVICDRIIEHKTWEVLTEATKENERSNNN